MSHEGCPSRNERANKHKQTSCTSQMHEESLVRSKQAWSIDVYRIHISEIYSDLINPSQQEQPAKKCLKTER